MKSPPQVLIVEDDPLVRSVMARICEWLDFDVTTAEDGTAGITCLGEGRFDLVLTDLRMPGASGLEVIREALSLDPPAAVVIVSGFATPDEEAEIEALGAGFLRKPFDVGEARKVVADALGGF